MTLPDSTEPGALDPVLWDEACRIYGFVGGIDPVSLAPQQREIIDRAYAALAVARAQGAQEERAANSRLDGKWRERLAKERAEGVREERERWLDCAQIDATMEGPKLKGWNRSALDRLWRALATPETQVTD